MFVALLVIFISLLIFLWIKLTSKPEDFPPGPPRRPIVGSVFDMKNPFGPKPSVFWGIFHFQKQYGDIFGMYLGRTRAVVLTKFEDIKEVLNTNEASSRPALLPAQLRPGWEIMEEFDPILNQNRPPGVILSNGEYWREQRRFVLRHLRDFGFGKVAMEDSLNEEVKKLVDYIRPNCNEPLSLHNMLNISIVNALWQIMTGEKLGLDDQKLRKTVEIFDDFRKSNEGPTAAVANIIPFPKLLMMPGIKSFLGFDQLEDFFKRVTNTIKPSLEDHKASFDENNLRDFMDVYLQEIRSTTEPHSGFYKHKGEASLINVFIDLYFAGMETTSSTLLWSFLYILHFPQCQDKIFEEIEAHIGFDKMPSLEDRPKMPFTNAFLLEAMRFMSLVPMSVFHYAHDEIKIKNFRIPKDTVVISSTFHVNHDPEYFKNPEEFNPERFLDDHGKFIHDDRVSPFGIGKRACLGRSLAEKEYFLFFTGILQAYKLSPISGKALPKIGVHDVPVPGIGRLCPPFDLILTPRT